MSPLGWAKANIYLDKATSPPERGSLMEALFILVFNFRQKAKYYESIMPLTVNATKFEKAYRAALFPYEQSQDELMKERMVNFMNKKFTKPIKIRRVK